MGKIFKSATIVNLFLAFMFVSVFASVAAASPQGQQALVSITGRVSNAGRGIRDVRVEATSPHFSAHATTDRRGLFTMRVPRGQYTITAQRQGYTFAPDSRRIIVMGYTEVNFGVAVSIGGEVLNRRTRQPLAGVTVSASSALGEILEQAQTDSAGRFVFNNLTMGESFVISVESPLHNFPSRHTFIREITSDNMSLVFLGDPSGRITAAPVHSQPILLEGTVITLTEDTPVQLPPATREQMPFRTMPSIHVPAHAPDVHVVQPLAAYAHVVEVTPPPAHTRPAPPVAPVTLPARVEEVRPVTPTMPVLPTAPPPARVVEVTPVVPPTPAPVVRVETPTPPATPVARPVTLPAEVTPMPMPTAPVLPTAPPPQVAPPARVVEVTPVVPPTPAPVVRVEPPVTPQPPVQAVTLPAQITPPQAPVRPDALTLSGRVVIRRGAPIAGAQVMFFDAQNDRTPLATLTTNVAGEFAFNNARLGGTYIVRTQAQGFVFGETRLRNVNNRTRSIVIEGNYARNVVRGFVGYRDIRIAGATVTLLPSGATAVTGADGQYVISGVEPGTQHAVTIEHPDMTFRTSRVDFTGTARESRVDFQPLFVVSGRVSAGGMPVVGANVFANGNFVMQTNAQGMYGITFPANSSAVITVGRQGYSFYPSSVELRNIRQSHANTNFNASVSVTGRISNVGVGNVAARDITVNIYREDRVVATAQTDARGNFRVPSLGHYGNYVIRPYARGFNFRPESISLVNVRENSINQNFIMARAAHSVTGNVTVGGRPVRGAEINITGRPVRFFTDIDGNFEISNLEHGVSYTVTARMPNSNVTFNPVVIPSLEADTAVNFNSDLTISGRVLYNNQPMTNVTIEVNRTTHRVNPQGQYVITGLRLGGEFLVRPRAAGFVFTPESRTFTNINSNYIEQNFTATRAR